MEEEAAEAKVAPKGVNVPIEWVEVPTVLVDQIVGYTNADNVSRVAFAQLTFRPGLATPVAHPVAMLASTIPGWKRIRAQIDEMLKMADKQGTTEIGQPEVTKID